MAENNDLGRCDSARVIALVGPSGAGKTSLAEALLYASGTIDRQGTVDAGNTVGDASPEARARTLSTEMNVANFSFMGDQYALIDCPGSVNFAGEALDALPAVDLALVVVDPEPERAILAQPTLKMLEEINIPHALFVNKIDQARGSVLDLLTALQEMSKARLVARQLPIGSDGHVTGFVDLATERAFAYRPGAPSERIDIPAELAEQEAQARFHMLEQLADFDDELLEQLLSDMTPPVETVFADLVRETREGLIVPVFFGSALNDFGVRRLLKALRHETPTASDAAARVGADGAAAYVFKVSHASQVGKLALARIFGDCVTDGAELVTAGGQKARAGGLFAVRGANTSKIAAAIPGDIVAIAKVDPVKTGDLLSVDGRQRRPKPLAHRNAPSFALAIAPLDRKDDVRLSGALAKLVEEDPSLVWEQDEAMHETLLRGTSGEHLRLALDRLKRRYGIAVATRPPRVPYRESIRKSTAQRGRHKKQSGGHGQFGDVVIEISPLERGAGFQFSDRITGGAIPKQWIPAVEQGVRDAMEKGPLGFPVVDVAVVLVDGSFHSVDSSDLAFRIAGRMAMSEGLKACSPYLLEPILSVTVHTPNSATSRISSIISSRRGQILGFAPREGWPGWDTLDAYLPQAEAQDIGAELRSFSQGLATCEMSFAYMAELTGKPAEEIMQRMREPA